MVSSNLTVQPCKATPSSDCPFTPSNLSLESDTDDEPIVRNRKFRTKLAAKKNAMAKTATFTNDTKSKVVTLKFPKVFLAKRVVKRAEDDAEKVTMIENINQGTKPVQEEFVDPLFPNNPGYTLEPPSGYHGRISAHYDVSRFKLDSPRLIKSGPQRFRWSTERNPKTGEFDWEYPVECFPIAPPDDIKKELFFHPEFRKLSWSGPVADKVLKHEIRKYEVVKEFWLFEYQGCFAPGIDDKHIFCAYKYQNELQSPWVRGWLKELIGEDNLAKVLQSYQDNVIPWYDYMMEENSEKKWKALLEGKARAEARIAEEAVDEEEANEEVDAEVEQDEDIMDID